MALKPDQVAQLARAICETRDNELDCDEVVVYLAEWSERVRGGQSIRDASEAVLHHLSICPECDEELKLLTEVLRESKLHGN